MTEHEASERRKAREARVERILDLALDLTIKRLENVDDEEMKDNMSFDRLARTAQVLFRIVDEAHALVARQRKEQTDHDRTGAGAELDARNEEIAVALERRLDEHVRALGRRVAEHDAGGDERESEARGRVA